MKHPKIWTKCGYCNKEILMHFYRLQIARNVYCGKDCKYKSRKGLPSPNRIESNSTCKNCNTVFHCSPSRLNDKKIKRGVYCSRKCKDDFSKGKSSWNKGLKGIQSANNGSFRKRDWRFKGSQTEYQFIHYWVRKNLGKAFICEACMGQSRVEWANKSGLYKKEITDWVALCKRCHFKYDAAELGRSKYA